MNRRTALSTLFTLFTLFTLPTLALALALPARAAHSSPATDVGSQPRKKAASGRAQRIKTTPQHDNGESAADRDRRFRRECRGLPNAGACQGYGYGS